MPGGPVEEGGGGDSLFFMVQLIQRQDTRETGDSLGPLLQSIRFHNTTSATLHKAVQHRLSVVFLTACCLLPGIVLFVIIQRQNINMFCCVGKSYHILPACSLLHTHVHNT